MATIDPKKIRKFEISKLYKDSNVHSIYIEVDLSDLDLSELSDMKKKVKKPKFMKAHGTKA